jgi:hypothetical protein
MDNIGETLSALEQLKSQLDAIGKSEIGETERMLRNLMTDVVSIGKKELGEEEKVQFYENFWNREETSLS